MLSLLRGVLDRLESRFRLLTIGATLVPTMSALLFQLVTFTITARGLGVEQFGIYTGLLALVGVFVELTGLGSADLLVRGVSKDVSSFARYYGNLLLSVLFTLPLAVLASLLIASLLLHIELPLWPMALALLAEIMVSRVSASTELVMVAHGHTVRAGWVRLATVLARLFMAVLYFLLFHQTQLVGWIDVVLLQSVLMSVFYLLLSARLYGAPHFCLLARELHSGVMFSLNQSSRAMQTNLDRMILARFTDATTLGSYGAASRVLQLGLFPMQVLTRIYYPHFFREGSKGFVSAFRYGVSVAPTMFVAGVVSALVVSVCALAVPDLLGKGFQDSVHSIFILSASLPLIALQYPAADVLTGGGRQGLRTVIFTASTFGFGFVLVGGVLVFGFSGLLYAFVFAHFLLACVLWGAAFLCCKHSRVS